MINRRSVLSGMTAATFASLSLTTQAKSHEGRPLVFFEPSQFGAKGDGKALDSPAINKAITECTRAGGGIVYLRPGIYRSGTVELKSNVTLYLEAGSVILGSLVLEDYTEMPGPPRRGDANQTHLIFARDAENVTLEGSGRIDGQGQSFWEPSGRAPLAASEQWAEVTAHAYHKKGTGRPSPMMEFVNCRWLRIAGLRIENSAGWTLRPINCDKVVIENIAIKNPNYGPNTDGLDLTGCQNVFVSNCSIDTGDDAICLKSENPYGDEPRLAKNIVITNCVLTTCCNGFKLGTATRGGFENITFSNSVIHNKEGEFKDRVIAGIALEAVDGGWIDGVVISGIRMQRTRTPVFIRLGNRTNTFHYPKNGIGGVLIQDIHASETLLASSITGIPGHAVEDITIANLRAENVLPSRPEWINLKPAEKEDKYPEARMFGMLPVSGLYVRHVRGLQLRDVHFGSTPTENRPTIAMEDARNVAISGLTTTGITGDQSVLKLKSVSHVWLRDCASPSAASFIATEATCSDILVSGCDLRQAQTITADAAINLHGNITKA